MSRQVNKVLSTRTTSIVQLEAWPYEEFPGDPWWAGGNSPAAYRWELTATIQPQVHGNPSTPTPYRYNGLDVEVGDWIANTQTGRSLRITQILSKNSSTVNVVVEDVDRYNTFQDENGSGIFPIPSDTIIFSINDMKMPILTPLPSTVSNVFANEVLARFQNNNPLYSFRFPQVNHGLTTNQAIWVNPDTGVFEVATGDNLKKMVGTIDKVVSPDVFYLEPTTKIIESMNPPLPGSAGDIIYADVLTGDLTADPTDQTKVAYIQLTDATPDTVSGSGDILFAGWILNINNVDVEFTSNTLVSAQADINAKSDQHNVVASVNQGVTKSASVPSNLLYGLIICQGLSSEITLNGVTVLFNDDTNGSQDFGGGIVNALDMANTINSAGIANITAEGVGATSLSITNSQGGPIDIVNVNNDAGGTPFAGSGSCSGLNLTASSGGSNFLSFVNSRGTGIIFKDTLGVPITGLELISSRNGKEPAGLVVEQSVSSVGGVTVYADIPSLPVTGKVGEQAYVIDSNDGTGNKDNEWTMFLWEGASWVKTSDEDSAATDANSATITITPATPVEEIITKISNNSRVTLVTVNVNVAFDGNASLVVGDSDSNDRLMKDYNTDLSSISTYATTSNFLYNIGQDTDIIAYFDASGSTVGEATIVLSYQ